MFKQALAGKSVPIGIKVLLTAIAIVDVTANVAPGQDLGRAAAATQALIEAFGWRGAMLALGGGTLALLLPLAAFMRPAPVGGAATAGEPPIRPGVSVPILSAAVFLCCTCMAVPLLWLALGAGRNTVWFAFVAVPIVIDAAASLVWSLDSAQDLAELMRLVTTA